MKKSLRRMAALSAGLVAATFGSSSASADTWRGQYSNYWTTGVNWTTSFPPGPADAANFYNASPSSTSIILDYSETVASMAIQQNSGNPAYNFSDQNGATLTISGLLNEYDDGVIDGAANFNSFTASAGSLAMSGNQHAVTLNLSGSSSLTTSGVASIGVSGSTAHATLNINNGATFKPDSITLNQNGVLNLNAGGNLFVGTHGLTINSGGTLSVASGVGFSLSNNTTTSVQGQLALNIPYSLAASNTLAVSSGGQVASMSYLDLADTGSGVATMTIDGSGSVVKASVGGGGLFSEWADTSGAGANVTLSNFGVGSYATGLHIASDGAGTAVVNLQSNAQLLVANGLNVGGVGTTTINITNAGLISNGIANFSNNSTINLNSGSIALNDNATFSAGSTLNWSGGTVSIASGKTLNVAGGTVKNTAGGVGLTGGATVAVTTSGKFSNSSNFDVGGNAGGTLLVDGSGSQFTAAGTSDWGFNSGYTGNLTFSNSAVGTFAAVRMSDLGGAATVNLQSNASLNVSSLQAGLGTASTQLSLINIAGGALNDSGVATFLGGAMVNLSSGTLALSGNTTFSMGSSLSLSSGTISVASGKTLTFNNATASFTSPKTLALSSGATLAVINGGHFSDNLSFDISNSNYTYSGQTGTLLVTGSGSSYSNTGTSSATYWGFKTGDVASVTFSSNSVGTISGGVIIAEGGSSANVSVLSGASLNIANSLAVSNSTGSSGNATLTISGGALNSSGKSVFYNGAIVNLSGAGSLYFGNDATFLTGSKLNNVGTSTVLSIASGHTLTFNGGVGSFTSSPGYTLPGGSTLQIINGGHFSSDEFFGLGSTYTNPANATGTLLVSGSGSSFTDAGAYSPIWGDKAGDVAIATFTSNAVGTFYSGLVLGYAGATANLSVLNGASLNIGGQFIVGSYGGSGSVATLTINGGTLNESSTNGLGFYPGTTVNYLAGGLNLNDTLLMSDNTKILCSAGGNKVIKVQGLQMTSAAKIDLSDNDLIVDYTGSSPLSTIQGYLLTGRNGGSWNGNGITSSAAAANPTHVGLGIAEASALYGASGGTYPNGGNPVAVDGTTVIVKYTYLGDANLDGKVDIADLGALATHYGQSSQTWTGGDFNYDGTVNIADLGILATDYGLGATTPLSLSFEQALAEVEQQTGVQLPEPAVVAIMAVGFGVLRHRPFSQKRFKSTRRANS